LDDNEEDNSVLVQLITPGNDPYDDKISVEDWNLILGGSDDEHD